MVWVEVDDVPPGEVACEEEVERVYIVGGCGEEGRREQKKRKEGGKVYRVRWGSVFA